MKTHKKERNATIVSMREKGLTYDDIGKIMHLTRQRVYQIVKRTLSTTPLQSIDKKGVSAVG